MMKTTKQINLTELINCILLNQCAIAETEREIANCEREMKEIEMKIRALEALKLLQPLPPLSEMDPYDGVPADTGNH